MEELSHLLVVCDQSRILICTVCHFAVVSTQVGQHLRQHHKRVTQKERREITTRIQDFNNLAQIESEVIHTESNSAPVDGLPIFFDGFRCLATSEQGQACQYVCQTLYGIKEHCKREHSWINVQKRGGNARLKQPQPANKLWRHDCACQRFFKVGLWQRYFEVKADIANGPNTGDNDDQRNAFFQSQREDMAHAELDAAEDANRVRSFDDHCSTVVP